MTDGRVEPGEDVGTSGAGGLPAAAGDLLRFANTRRFATFLVDPPWRFTNKTGKVAPEHKRLARYGTMTLPEIMALPLEQLAAPAARNPAGSLQGKK